MKTILVTGANGQLGSEMRLVAAVSSCLSVRNGAASCPSAESGMAGEFRFIFTDVVDASEESLAMLSKLGGRGVDTSTVHLDITDIEAIRAIVRSEGVDAIVNCAAWTNVDACETDPAKAALAEKLNADAPRNLATVMAETGGLLAHISTDYVFGVEPYNVPCREDQKGTPTGVYGRTKLHGEQAILESGCRSVILRTAWLYSEFGRNFCRTMLSLTGSKPSLKVVFDQAGTPTYALDLAEAIFAILRNPVPGIYHYSNEGVTSWYDFTKMIASLSGHASCDIQPCHSAEFPSPVTRPSYSVLDKTKVKETFGLKVPYWVDSLRKCLSNLGELV